MIQVVIIYGDVRPCLPKRSVFFVLLVTFCLFFFSTLFYPYYSKTLQVAATTPSDITQIAYALEL